MIKIRYISALALFAFLLFSTYPLSGYSQNCPPCETEKRVLDNAREKLREAAEKHKELSRRLMNAIKIFMICSSHVYDAAVTASKECGPSGVRVTLACFEALKALSKCQDNLIIALDELHKCEKEIYVASKESEEAMKNAKEAKKAYDECMKISVPICKKCENGKIVNDDTQDPGMCWKCENGNKEFDDQEDPGMCIRCQSGSPSADNSEDPGKCWKCENMVAVPDDNEVPDDGNPCTEDWCSGGAEFHDWIFTCPY